MRLAGARPVYVYPQMISGYGIQGRITAEAVAEAMDREPQGKAVILPSPNYYGICSDISAIADVVHRRGKVLIVDQAHGAHLKFFRGCHAGSTGPGKMNISAGISFRLPQKIRGRILSSTAPTKLWLHSPRQRYSMCVPAGWIRQTWRIASR